MFKTICIFLFCVFIFDIWTVYHVLFIKDQFFLNRCNNTRITQIKHDWCKILSCVKYKLCFMSDINNHHFYIGAKPYDNSASKQMNFHLPWLKSQAVESSDFAVEDGSCWRPGNALKLRNNMRCLTTLDYNRFISDDKCCHLFFGSHSKFVYEWCWNAKWQSVKFWYWFNSPVLLLMRNFGNTQKMRETIKAALWILSQLPC